MSFYNKYLKYKNKYLQLKNLNYIQHGGELPIIYNDNINLFTDPDMEKFMNPIHGLVLCYTGTISNNYWLAKSGFIKKDVLGYNIIKVIRTIPGNVQPTKKLLENLDPIDYGRFIAIKYINMKNFMPKVDLLGKDLKQLQLKNKNITKENHELLLEYIKKINSDTTYFPVNDSNINTFHIILYSMCWVCNNDNGIKEYYDGIQEIFNLLEIPLELKPQSKPNSYEKQVISIINKNKFKIFNQEYANNFCKTPSKYPDCGETTALNLINLLCWNEKTFDISKLKNPIDQLKEFYCAFTNFNLMIDSSLKKDLFGQKLNARDAWSYIIIKYANYNLNFLRSCEHKFELNARLSADGKNTNFFQLIKNLLQIDKWDDIINNNITKINDYTKDGIGSIEINHSIYGNTIINCLSGHYYMEPFKIEKTESNLVGLTKVQACNINMLENKLPITNETYLDIDINPESLEYRFNRSPASDIDGVSLKLLFLSLTDKYNDDLRRRMLIVLSARYFNYLAETIKNLDNADIINKINKYTYNCLDNDLSSLLKIPLTHINLRVKRDISSIDLAPLINIKSIGDNFLMDCKNLKSINLSGLSNVKSIGNNFLYTCEKIENIDLSPLLNLESVGHNFLSDCKNLKSINLSGLDKVKTIGNSFLSLRSNFDDNLERINLSGLLNIETIDGSFLYNRNKLTSIDLSSLSKLKSIGFGFLTKCTNLTSIDLSGLSELESIGDNFLSDCTNLTSIIITKQQKDIIKRSNGNKFDKLIIIK